MLTDYEISQLPDDPKAGFATVVETLRAKRILLDKNSQGFAIKRKYIANIRAYAEVHNLNFSFESPPSEDDFFWDYYQGFEQELDYFTSKCRFETLRGIEPNELDSFKLGDDHRLEIHNHLNKIRKIINAIDLDRRLKENILSRINKLGTAVDKHIHWASAVADTMMELTSATGKSAEQLEPAIKAFERVTGILGRARQESDVKKLASPEDTKLLEGPEGNSSQTDHTDTDDLQ